MRPHYPVPRPSAHLSWQELACRDGTPYPPSQWETGVALGVEFERIRHACGDHPLLILSSFRTARWNERCGGEKHSYHLVGLALDIQVCAGWDELRFYKLVRDLALETHGGRRVSKIRGLGRYPERGFVHIDLRNGHGLTCWQGTQAHYLPLQRPPNARSKIPLDTPV